MSCRTRPRPHPGPLRMAGFVASVGVVVALAASGPATVGGFDATEPHSTSLVPELRSPDFDLPRPPPGIAAAAGATTIRNRRRQPTIPPAAVRAQAWPSASASAPARGR